MVQIRALKSLHLNWNACYNRNKTEYSVIAGPYRVVYCYCKVLPGPELHWYYRNDPGWLTEVLLWFVAAGNPKRDISLIRKRAFGEECFEYKHSVSVLSSRPLDGLAPHKLYSEQNCFFQIPCFPDGNAHAIVTKRRKLTTKRWWPLSAEWFLILSRCHWFGEVSL